MEVTLAGYLLAIANATSTFGRIVPGILADKYGRLNILSSGAIVTGVVIFVMNYATSDAGLIVFAVFFGFVSGTIVSGATTALSDCAKDPRDVGTTLGMGMSLTAVGILIGPPINGALLRTYGGFYEVSMFSGTMCLFGGLVALATKTATPKGIFGRI